MHDVLSGRRVLVVEDEMMVLMNIEDALADLGSPTVSCAATVDGALALLEAERFDVAMLDVNLEGQASYRVAEALALRSIPFVFSTGYGEQGIEAQFGDRPVLRKPYSDQQLGAALASLLPAGHEVVPSNSANSGDTTLNTALEPAAKKRAHRVRGDDEEGS